MKIHFYILLIYLPAIALVGQPTKEQIKAVETAKKEVKRMKGQPFPDFALTTLEGTVITKEDTKGKILLVNFWFSRCKPCIMEMPEMNEMVKELKDEEIIFLAPTFDDAELVDKFLDKRDFDYHIIPNVKDFCLEMNVRSYPTHFIVNREGIIEKVIIGYSSMTVGALKKTARKLLKSE
ncbi:TlpA family protein disulfide reductase [Ekhidna sp.]|uniref:TlpA family protein disulfide reductase n=1 Tax=Ekhidna sp. TaxID=2608089 RepID=UPI003512B570